MRQHAAFLATLLTALAASCSKSGSSYGELACLDGWPTAGAAERRPSSSATPAIRWQANLGRVAYPNQPGVALSNDRVIASGGSAWVALDRATGAQVASGSTRPEPLNYFLGAPAVDEQGMIYVQSHVSLHAFAPDGSKRWSWAIPGQTPSSEPVSGRFTPSVAGAIDRRILSGSVAELLAFSAEPKLAWTSRLGVRASAGHWGIGDDGAASYVLDLRTGKPAGRLRLANGHDVVALLPLAGRGILVMDRDNAAALTLVLLDTCGAEIWTLRVPGSKVCVGTAVVGPGEIVYLGIGSCSGGQPAPSIVGVGPDGKIVSGPTPSTRAPWVVGADGTLYTVELGALVPPSKLAALSPTLETLWTVDLPGVLAAGASAVLASDGVLYAQMTAINGDNIVVAVQTASPGLASSSWPATRHDNRASNWAGGQF